MTNVTGYILSNDNLVVHTGGSEPLVIPRSHPQIELLIEYAQNSNFEGIENTMMPPVPDFIDDEIQVVKNRVLIDNQPVSGYVFDKMVELHQGGYPIQALSNFIRNMNMNPDETAKADLYKFLEVNGLPLTEDGFFIGYRSIRVDWKDGHSGTMDNSVGKYVQMQRSKCDPNPNQSCSRGLHVGGYSYFNSSFSGDHRMIAVKVNPRDVVAVPDAYSSSKLRCCAFLVTEELCKEELRKGDVLKQKAVY